VRENVFSDQNGALFKNGVEIELLKMPRVRLLIDAINETCHNPCVIARAPLQLLGDVRLFSCFLSFAGERMKSIN
jgi:hypothetical protein